MENEDRVLTEEGFTDLGTASEQTKGMAFGTWDGGNGLNFW